MSVPSKFPSGAPFPQFSWPAVEGGSVTPGTGDDWRLVFIYRGAHCPVCTNYLHELSQLRDEIEGLGIRFWALSADPLERVRDQAQRENWNVPLLAELLEDQMRALGLYISSPHRPGETDRNFAEPATFAINPEGNVQIVDISNAPFTRTDPRVLLQGLTYVVKNGYPIRGTAE